MLVDFYHLAASPLEQVLPKICEKLIDGGQRLIVVAEPQLLGPLDKALWGYRRDGFLPHGRHDSEQPEKQPILLSPVPEPINGATNIALADGLWRDEALGFERTFYFFGQSRLDGARTSWRALKAAAQAELRYWKQDEQGRWVQGP